VQNGKLYWFATFYSHPTTFAWFVSNGKTITNLGPTWPGPGPQPQPEAQPKLFSDSISIGRTRYYAFDDHVHGRELWASDLNGKHAHLVADVYPGPLSSSPDDLALVDGRLVFTASSPQFGRELFVLPIATAATVVPVSRAVVAGDPEKTNLDVLDVLYAQPSD
jgi:ELWxxDGT repeat protein